ncbi:MAG: hypothetical protein CVU50_05020 [Candidatus Cloacimonetes bacterium HGW-Cloacimonetes-3]|jgi:hypothetical protein|nr:MAG: hypothetical protein CVU50_05020 [Candidatus Cloacimonetes bacterium HGW-Cloacimonetes-3]
MGFFNRRKPRHPVLANIAGFVGVMLLALASLQAKDMLMSAAYGVLALGFVHEAIAIGLQHRAVRTLERIPFLVVFFILLLLKYIT